MKNFHRFLNNQSKTHSSFRIYHNLENKITSIHFAVLDSKALLTLDSFVVVENVLFPVAVGETYKNLDFSQALALLKSGNRLSRSGWLAEEVGSDSWICLAKGAPALESKKFWNEHSRQFAYDNGGSAEVVDYFLLKTVDDKIQMGWSPSQEDCLATDWYLVT